MKPGDVRQIPFTECIDCMIQNVRKQSKSGTIDLTYMFEQLTQCIWYLNEYMKHFEKQGYIEITTKDGKDEQRTSNDRNI